MWSKGVSRSGGIRGRKRGMCAPFVKGGEWLQRTVLGYLQRAERFIVTWVLRLRHEIYWL